MISIPIWLLVVLCVASFPAACFLLIAAATGAMWVADTVRDLLAGVRR